MLWIYCGLVFLASALFEAALAVSVTSKRDFPDGFRPIFGLGTIALKHSPTTDKLSIEKMPEMLPSFFRNYPMIILHNWLKQLNKISCFDEYTDSNVSA
ncbi:hypothetical protein TcasGA2_TC012602 [Tribolium castaneum]|uniref:Secreted protein n=1 Tax=Tribolium castaneum TaxID=7070 RepID=D6WZ44_TRICA|nr:hypothetical protein TcasGA2_TC012602 [Tribolium castaneum]